MTHVVHVVAALPQHKATEHMNTLFMNTRLHNTLQCYYYMHDGSEQLNILESPLIDFREMEKALKKIT